MTKTDDFVSWHTHSDMSQLDGCGKISEYVKAAAARGHRAIAFSDHGTVRGIMTQHEQCTEHNIKPIYGTEFYVSKNMRRRGVTDDEKAEVTKGLRKSEFKAAIKNYEEREGIRDRWHLTVWAQNEVGLKNLYRLSSLSFLEGFYYKPRIDLEELIKYGDGLIVASGCLASPINDSWVAGKKRQALGYADKLYEAFGDRFMLEIQPHAIEDQRRVNELMLLLRKRYSRECRLLATQDAHYVERADAQHHEVLLCIGTGTNLSDPDRFKFDGDEFHFRTRKEMFRAFQQHHEHIPSQLVKAALDTTIELAETCNAKIEVDYKKALLPDPGIPKKYAGDDIAYLKDLCLRGWTWREIPRRAGAFADRMGLTLTEAISVYAKRLKKELKVISGQRFVPYFLLIQDICRFVRESKIMMGPGRGSVGGSLVAYLIGITAVDPIEHALMFERFLAPGRTDLPDADLDFEDRRAGEIIAYLRQKYGQDNVCQIATIGKLSGKECVRSVSRVLGVPLMEVGAITGSIIDRQSGDERAHQTVEDSFAEFEVCKQFNKKYPKVLHHARKLEGMAKTLGIHAAGVITSPVPLTEIIPLEVRKEQADGQRVVVSAFDMYGVAANGLVKIDVLRLRTLTVMRDALDAIEERHGLKFSLEKDVDLNDPKVLRKFTDHDFGGVFQFDTASADKLCQGVEFRMFDDIAAVIALNRPGPINAGLAEKWVARRKNAKLASTVDYHPAVSDITADTLGVIVYQEHVLRIFSEVAGFSPEKADYMRKIIGKKIGDETLNKERPGFIAGAAKYSGMSEKIANAVMDAIIKFGSYGFNRAHSVEYATIGFWAQWLKTYYPIEFYWGLLRNEPDRARIQQIAKDAARHGVELLPPHVSSSRTHFRIVGANTIRGSLVDIKGVGDGAAEAIMVAQPFKDIFDFAARIDRRKCNRGAVKSLAKAGAFEGLLPNTKWFIENIETAWGRLTSKRKSDTPAEARKFLDASVAEPDYTATERIRISSSVNPLTFGQTLLDAYASFIKRKVKVSFANATSETYFEDYDNKGHFLLGAITGVKIHQIGDFELTKEEAQRKQPVMGEHYAHVVVDDSHGTELRVKVDYDAFPQCQEILKRGPGVPIILHATTFARSRTLRAQFVVDLESFRRNLAKGDKLGTWESIVAGAHPAKLYPWKSEELAVRACTNARFLAVRHGSGIFTGIVTHVRLQADKRGECMAYWGMIGADYSYIEIMCFASVWREIQDAIRPGRLLKLQLDRQPDRWRGGISNQFSGGRIKWFRREMSMKEKTEYARTA
jgi:DNA polymerase-3 subunit alpha